MKRAVVLWGWVLLMFGGVFGLFLSCTGGTSISEEELLERCSRSLPTWTDYQEDIKGQIGAVPVARWAGEPIRVSAAGMGVEVFFLITGPWAGYEAALPILLRDPAGRVYRSGEVLREGAVLRYTFTLGADGVPPWIELHFPHTEQRIMLDGDGVWAAAESL